MLYVDVASGVTVQVATVNCVPVLAVMVLICPAPVPPTMRTWKLTHWLAVHDFVESDRVVAVAALAVPVAN
jgi:hypothetical protein